VAVIAKLIIEQLKNKYNVIYKEKEWKGVYLCELIIYRQNKIIGWIYWYENYKRKILKTDWLTFIPNDEAITSKEKEELAKIVDEINDRLGVWHPRYCND
jgi:hypothetical protein